MPLPPSPPPAPPPPGLLQGSVFFTLIFSVCGGLVGFAAFFATRVGEQRPEWRPPASSAQRSLRASPTFRGRVRLLSAALFATDEEVAARSGADARDYIRLQRVCAVILASALAPACLGVLPLVLAGGGGASGFARTTVANVTHESEPAVLWAITVCAFASTAAVHAGASLMDAHLRRVRHAEQSAASVTLLLRGLARSRVADNRATLLALFAERWPGTVHDVHVPRDRRAERATARQLSRAAGARRVRLEARLAALRAREPRGAGIAFVVCSSPAHAARLLSALSPLRIRGVLGEMVSAGVRRALRASRTGAPCALLPWRADWAPPPENLYPHNIGLGPVGRAARTLAVNAVVFAVLACCACPSLVAVVSFDAAATHNAAAVQQRWLRLLAHVRNAGIVAGALLDWAPNLVTLYIMSNALPALLAWATRLERHLSSGSEARALLIKAAAFNCLNILVLLAFGRAALAALVQRARDCDWARAGGQQCTASFLHLLGQLYVTNSAAAVACLLITASTYSLALDLLQWRRGLRDAARALGRLCRQSPLEAQLLEVGAEDADQAAPHAPDTSIVFLHAYNLTIFTAALCYSALAPLVLVPGCVYFLGRTFTEKWLLVASPAARRPASDGSLTRTAVSLLRVAALVHVTAMAGYTRGRGGTRQAAMLTALALLLLLKNAAAALFSASEPHDTGQPDTPARNAALLAKAAAYDQDAAADAAAGLPRPGADAARFQFPG
jgi:hypothetical protein